MKIKIDEIIVDEAARIRKEIGSIDTLQLSIEKVGLLSPIVIDENQNLVAGYRRYLACSNLGLEEIDAKVVACNGDAIKLLEIEVAENWYRKDFTPEEILAAEQKRLAIIASRKKKGLFGRLWLWLKRLFRPTAVPPVTKAQQGPAGKAVE